MAVIAAGRFLWLPPMSSSVFTARPFAWWQESHLYLRLFSLSLIDRFRCKSQAHFQMLFVFVSTGAEGCDKEQRRGPLSRGSSGPPRSRSRAASLSPRCRTSRDHLYVTAKAALEVYRSVYSNQSARQPLRSSTPHTSQMLGEEVKGLIKARVSLPSALGHIRHSPPLVCPFI